MRSEFEKWLDENNMFMEIERKFNQEHNTYEYCAIRWIWESWQHQQSKVDELQKRVEELTVGCGLQRDHIKGLEAELKKAWTTVDQEGHKNHELVMLLKFVKEHFEMNGLDKAMPRVYEKLEQALKGGSDEIQNR